MKQKKFLIFILLLIILLTSCATRTGTPVPTVTATTAPTPQLQLTQVAVLFSGLFIPAFLAGSFFEASSWAGRCLVSIVKFVDGICSDLLPGV